MPIQGVNDFVIRFANVNGSGSASANLLFARSILRMGVPIAPRNIFPSNIQGLPTWYEVRVTAQGHLGARGGTDLMVAMNPQTFDKDVASIEAGGYLFYDSSRPIPASKLRDDIVVLAMPLTDICTREYADPRQRQLFKNIVYVGALAALLDIEIGDVEKLIGEQFKGKDRLIAPNLRALRIGYDDARSRFACPLAIRVARSDAAGDRILADGNFAAGLGAVYGGATVCAWYPITPSTSLAEAFEKNCARLRVDRATGEKRYAIVQAEDEIAAIGMVVGAGWNGARAFTATSGPGISLMQEFLGLAYFAEVPAVLFDVQRGGPSTGMPTRTQQSDVLACAFASHGDTKHVLLFPDGPGEAFEFGALAFDLADRLQTPIFVMLDLDIGMNSHLCAPFQWDDSRKFDRGKVMSAADLESGREFGRYLDVDGDGIPWRSIPGAHPNARRLFHARHQPRPLRPLHRRGRPLRRQYGAAAAQVRHRAQDAAARRASQSRAADAHRRHPLWFDGCRRWTEATELLASEGVHVDALRIRAFPFGSEVGEFIAAHEQVFVVEQNRDAQLRTLLMTDLGIDAAQLVAILHYDGTPITARFIRREIAARASSLRRAADPRGRFMTYLAKPKFQHPALEVNALGFTHRDYEGAISTLCAGCGHDSISAAIIHACYELSLPPHRIAKLSGIGCSSKTPTYMLGQSHGFNSVHGRMPSVLTGANLANRELIYLGVSGDGDTASIGLGQFAHAMRRGVDMVYIVENNGVYGLTKGQFSATSDKGSKSKKGVDNPDSPIDLVAMALQLGATFVARSFSGDKTQLTPLIKAAFEHRGAAFIDVISPCVAFNNHEGSTKSFDYVREHNIALNALDFITGRDADRGRLSRRGERSRRHARRLGDPLPQARLRSRLARQVGGPGGARKASRRGRDRHRIDLYERRGGRSARAPEDDKEAAQRHGRGRALPGIEGA